MKLFKNIKKAIKKEKLIRKLEFKSASIFDKIIFSNDFSREHEMYCIDSAIDRLKKL